MGEPLTPASRFWAKVDRRTKGECWPWLGGKNPKGYGRYHVGPRQVQAHRFAYELTIGPVPDGLVLDHLCRNPGCANPYHCQPVTSRENTLRGQGPAAQAAQRTHCPQGHPYDTIRQGWRACSVCLKEQAARQREVHREHRLAHKREMRRRKVA